MTRQKAITTRIPEDTVLAIERFAEIDQAYREVLITLQDVKSALKRNWLRWIQDFTRIVYQIRGRYQRVEPVNARFNFLHKMGNVQGPRKQAWKNINSSIYMKVLN